MKRGIVVNMLTTGLESLITAVTHSDTRYEYQVPVATYHRALVRHPFTFSTLYYRSRTVTVVLKRYLARRGSFSIGLRISLRLSSGGISIF